MDIIERIDYLKKLNNWSTNKLAVESGLTQSTLQSIFTNRNLPSIPTLEKICSAFDMSLSEFFSEGKTELSPELQKLLHTAAKLTPEQQLMLQKFLDTIVSQMKE